MVEPMNIKRFANLLSADRELDEIERALRRAGERRIARRIAEIRATLAKALDDEQEEIWERLIKAC
jgi:hypothetical protein